MSEKDNKLQEIFKTLVHEDIEREVRRIMRYSDYDRNFSEYDRNFIETYNKHFTLFKILEKYKKFKPEKD